MNFPTEIYNRREPYQIKGRFRNLYSIFFGFLQEARRELFLREPPLQVPVLAGLQLPQTVELEQEERTPHGYIQGAKIDLTNLAIPIFLIDLLNVSVVGAIYPRLCKYNTKNLPVIIPSIAINNILIFEDLSVNLPR